MFWIASSFIEGFEVRGFWWAVLAALVYSIISWAISSLILGGEEKRP
jgi:putative membrane protein